MADQKRIALRQGHGTPKNIILRELPVANANPARTIYLYENHATPRTIILRDPTVVIAETPAGPSASLLHASVGSAGSGATVTSGSFTPAADDLLVVMVQATATVAAGALTGTGGITFTRVFSQTAGVAGTGYCFIGDSAAAASSQTVTFDCTGDDCTECGIHVYAVAGQSVYGTSAVAQSKTRQTSTTPTLTMDATPNTANVLIGAVFSQDNSIPICTEPSGWTEGAETDLGGNGMESCFVNGGYTTNPIVWGSNPGGGSQNGYGVVELQATLPVGQPAIKRFGGVPFASRNRGVW